ncbi:hypothetical protein [uncultured Mucilaginibacter sp.]|uniref:hypothetical protein n=1 Tax=uncultured Mucilaginibacter sp. TaxID=797541 RepID=UPI0025E6CF08|nr:hypothetical protein [uncultured Mucilaginibacter sp.]
MVLIRILVLLVLLVVFFQDLKSRYVYWILFPALLILFFATSLLQHRSFSEILQPAAMNLSFLVMQFLLVSAYFSLKNRRWVNITAELLGWGDILLLLSIAFYFSVLNFLFFYIISLVVSVIAWLSWKLMSKGKNTQIPLAGFQAICLVVFLMSDWYWLHFNTADDTWLLNLIHK